ncbi:hypothetical protein scyTo_0002008 [Scyliorhinus torazame]|uniref:Uncharacterized protein n=1 Tax=Scyliorhinus torazame TaxID=75743 RepID=A0A401PH59_SCYTO|nr:hypothetical protein [Scyliorhinus torazame]
MGPVSYMLQEQGQESNRHVDDLCSRTPASADPQKDEPALLLPSTSPLAPVSPSQVQDPQDAERLDAEFSDSNCDMEMQLAATAVDQVSDTNLTECKQ